MPQEQTNVQVPVEILQRLADAAEQMGISLPGVTRFAPTIKLTQPIRNLALELGRIVSKYNIFLKGTQIVTVDEVTGEERVMTTKAFPSWTEEYCAFDAAGTRRTRNSLSVEEASQILESQIFLECLRPLNAVHTMRLPVQRTSGCVEFLEAGYDVESAIYTADNLQYDMAWPLDRAIKHFENVCSEFPFNRAENETGLLLNRSFAVHVLACLGAYCAAMFPVGTLRPMIAYFGNKPGTGKTRLAEMTLAHVHGYVAATGAPKDDEKMEVKLETIANSMQPFVIFDDIGGSLRSNHLNRFITESMHGGRRYHSNSEFFKVPNVTQVYVTANDLPTSEDLDRRALIVELFLEEEVRSRKFKRFITNKWLADNSIRSEFLSACCAFVRNWLNSESYGEKPVHPDPLPTFEEWTAVMAGMVRAAELADPLKAREGVVGGSGQEDEIKQLLILMASETEESGTITRQELVDFARTKGMLEDLVGLTGQDLDAAATKRFGRRMQRWRGQKLKDNRGRVFQFGHKRANTGAVYPLVFL